MRLQRQILACSRGYHSESIALLDLLYPEDKCGLSDEASAAEAEIGEVGDTGDSAIEQVAEVGLTASQYSCSLAGR